MGWPRAPVRARCVPGPPLVLRSKGTWLWSRSSSGIARRSRDSSGIILGPRRLKPDLFLRRDSTTGSRALPFLVNNFGTILWTEIRFHIEPRHDARPKAATAAAVLGGRGIFARAVDGAARLAAAVMVGSRAGGVRSRGLVVCSEVSLAGQGALFGRVVSVGRFSDSDSRSGSEGTPAG